MKNKIKKMLSVIIAIITIFTNVGFAETKVYAASYTLTYNTTSFFTFKNIGTGRYLNIYGNKKANNTNVDIYSWDGTTGQKFKLSKSGSGFRMTAQCATSKALNVYGNSAKNGSNVCLWSPTGHTTQQFTFEYNSTYKAFIIRSVNNKNLVLTATGSKNSSNVCLKTYQAGNKNQLWGTSAITVKENKAATKTTIVTKATTNVTNKATSATKAAVSSTFIWPIENGKGNVSSDAGQKRSGYIHVGTDIGGVSEGDKIISIANNGIVKRKGNDNDKGYYVVILYGDYLVTYQHMKSNSPLSVGDSVSQGQTVGYVGHTGDCIPKNYNHLHIEISLYSTMSKAENETYMLFHDVNRNRCKPTYYTISKGSALGNSKYALNLKKVN